MPNRRRSSNSKSYLHLYLEYNRPASETPYKWLFAVETINSGPETVCCIGYPYGDQKHCFGGNFGYRKIRFEPQCGYLTSVDSEAPVRPPFKLRNSI